MKCQTRQVNERPAKPSLLLRPLKHHHTHDLKRPETRRTRRSGRMIANKTQSRAMEYCLQGASLQPAHMRQGALRASTFGKVDTVARQVLRHGNGWLYAHESITLPQGLHASRGRRSHPMLRLSVNSTRGTTGRADAIIAGRLLSTGAGDAQPRRHTERQRAMIRRGRPSAGSGLKSAASWLDGQPVGDSIQG